MTKFYEFVENNITHVAVDGSMIVIKDRTYTDSGENEAITALLANISKKSKCKSVTEEQYNSVRASFALNDPHHALREQIRQQILAETGTKGMGVSANVNDPTAGVSNESRQLVEQKTDAADLLKSVANKSA